MNEVYRVEKKYLLEEVQYRKFRHFLEQVMTVDNIVKEMAIPYDPCTLIRWRIEIFMKRRMA